MFNFKIIKQSKKSHARLGEMVTNHGVIKTPVFMPVGTVGSVKGVSPEELNELDAEIILGNTYHLYLRPGDKFIKKAQGLHKFINWDKPILTDSGGFQVFSLGANMVEKGNFPGGGKSLVKIKDNGVEFRSFLDGSKHYFTPEKVIDIQTNLGSDIMMVLDVCTEFPASHSRAKEAMDITHAWAKKAIDYYAKNKRRGALFGIVQGSTYKDLRAESLRYISSLPFDGVAVGGVSVGEGKAHMYNAMRWTGANLPSGKPRYIMGIGEPEDIVEAVKNGFDMFDCVLPTRLARHGVVWINKTKNKFQKLDLRKGKFKEDLEPIEKGCECYACKNKFSRAYIAHLIKQREILGIRLTTMHNIHFIINLVKNLREDIKNNKL